MHRAVQIICIKGRGNHGAGRVTPRAWPIPAGISIKISVPAVALDPTKHPKIHPGAICIRRPSCALLLGNDSDWHHIVAIYSADLTNLGASYNTIIYIDGDKCGYGLIPQPYTDVGGPANDTGNSQQNTSLWYVSARQESNNDRYGSGGIASGGRLNGYIDEIRVYEHVLTGAAVTWLKNNTGD